MSRDEMSRDEMLNRWFRLHDKLLYSCYALYDALNRFDDCFDWMEKCRAYERAAAVLAERLGK